MKIPYGKFKAILNRRTLSRLLDKSLLPFEDSDRRPNKEAFLKDLYDDIMSKKYFPSLPRGYILLDKHNGVTRIIPVFNYRDMCVYYLCVKEIEECIAINRVAGTYGGWTMGNPIRVLEEAERAPKVESKEPETSSNYMFEGYYVTSTLDPERWVENFRDYQGRAREWSRPEYLKYFLKFDIANFFDAINLDILERKIRAAVPLAKYETVDLLFVFLRNWNREFEGYGMKSVGIPQNDAGDCSRMLANFYLLDYDDFMAQICEQAAGGGRYLRYSDDQIIMTETAADAHRILFAASKELHKIGLNINSGKVIEFESREEYSYYWAFDIFWHLGDREDIEKVKRGVEMFVERVQRDGWDPKVRPWRSETALKRVLNVGLSNIEPSLRNDLLKIVLDDQVLLKLDAVAFEKVYRAVDEAQQQLLVDALERFIPIAYFNNFHLNVLRFYGKCRKGVPVEHIKNKLRDLTYN